jgi:hypothetical protein
MRLVRIEKRPVEKSKILSEKKIQIGKKVIEKRFFYGFRRKIALKIETVPRI